MADDAPTPVTVPYQYYSPTVTSPTWWVPATPGATTETVSVADSTPVGANPAPITDGGRTDAQKTSDTVMTIVDSAIGLIFGGAVGNLSKLLHDGIMAGWDAQRVKDALVAAGADPSKADQAYTKATTSLASSDPATAKSLNLIDDNGKMPDGRTVVSDGVTKTGGTLQNGYYGPAQYDFTGTKTFQDNQKYIDSIYAGYTPEEAAQIAAMDQAGYREAGLRYADYQTMGDYREDPRAMASLFNFQQATEKAAQLKALQDARLIGDQYGSGGAGMAAAAQAMEQSRYGAQSDIARQMLGQSQFADTMRGQYLGFNANAFNTNQQFNAGSFNENQRFNAGAYNENQMFNVGEANKGRLTNAELANAMAISNNTIQNSQLTTKGTLGAKNREDATPYTPPTKK